MSWLFSKRGRVFELGTNENKSSNYEAGIERDENPGPPDCESNALTTRSHSLLKEEEEDEVSYN